MITYGGCDLTPTTAASEAAATWWHGHRINLFDFQGFLVPNVQHLPTPYLPRSEEPRIGVLSWPTGADRFASCCLIATGAELAKVRQVLGTNPEAQPLVFSDGHVTITTGMYLIGVHPISQRSDGHELYLLVLVDERYFWWQTGGSTTPATAASWNSLFTQLFSALGVTPTISAIPAAYLTPNMGRWGVGVQPFPMVIEAAAMTVGSRVVRNFDGTVVVTDYATAFDVDRLRWEQYRYECLAGGLVSGSDIARGLPDSADTVFFDGAVETTTLASLAPLLAAGVTGVFGRSGRITADPANPTAPQRAAYALRAATDYYNWAFSRTDATLRGFQNVPICGLDDCVEWVHTPETMVTRILRPIWSDRNVYGEEFPQENTGEGCGEYRTECEDGFLIQYRCEDGEWVYDSSTGVPCDDPSGTGVGSPFEYPVVFRPVTNVCPSCPPAVGELVLLLADTNDPACFLPANGSTASRAVYAELFAAYGTTFGTGDGSTTFTLPTETYGGSAAFAYFVRAGSTALTVQKQRVTIQAFGIVETVTCETNPDDCCSGTGTGTGIDTCCPTGTSLTVVTFAADGPMGAKCATCELTGDLLLVDGVGHVWKNSGAAGGCGGDTGLDVTLYCAGGHWRLAGELAPPDLSTVYFDVAADLDIETLLLTGIVNVPGCGTVVIAVEQPCPAVVSYNCAAGTCVPVLGTGGTYATAELCAAACGALTASCNGVDFNSTISRTLYLHYGAAPASPCTGGYAFLNGTTSGPLTWDGAKWAGLPQDGFTVIQLTPNSVSAGRPVVNTSGSTFAGCANDTTGLSPVTCTPFLLSNNVAPLTGTCQTGTDNLGYIVNETP